MEKSPFLSLLQFEIQVENRRRSSSNDPCSGAGVYRTVIANQGLDCVVVLETQLPAVWFICVHYARICKDTFLAKYACMGERGQSLRMRRDEMNKAIVIHSPPRTVYD